MGSSRCCTPSSVFLGVTASRSLCTHCLAGDPSPAWGGAGALQPPPQYSLQCREDLRVLAGFLLPELVAREAQDDEPVGPQLIL